MERPEKHKKCSECGSVKLVRDYERAELVCAGCGFIIHSKINGAFLDRADSDEHCSRFYIIDANQEIEDVFYDLVTTFKLEIIG